MAVLGDAPVDPRLSWDIPALGHLPRIAPIDTLVTRVIAPNPTAMTLDGTNTYVVGAPGAGGAVLVDPGPEIDAHLSAVQEVLAQRDLGVDAIFVTHHHLDHAAAARAWSLVFDCPIVAGDRQIATASGRVAEDGDALHLAGGQVARVVTTPGHTRDHLALRLPNDMLLTGDHILGRGTTVVTYPDGDMPAYFASLRKTAAVGAALLLPGHGPELAEDPGAVVTYYLEHRTYRLQQIIAVLARAPATVAVLVEEIYGALDEGLLPHATASTRAACMGLVAAEYVHLCNGGTPPDGPFELTGRRPPITL